MLEICSFLFSVFPIISPFYRLAQVVDRALGEDAIRSRQESVQMVERWNSGTQDYPDRSCLHDMFRESAKKNRDATAILYKVLVDNCFGRGGRARGVGWLE